MEIKTNKFQKLLEGYFNEELSSKETKQLEGFLSEDKYLKEFLFQKQLFDISNKKGPSFEEDVLEGVDLDFKSPELKRELEALAEKSRISNPAFTSNGRIIALQPKRLWRGMAASFLILVASSLFYANFNYSDQKIVTEAKPYEQYDPRHLSIADENQFEKAIALIYDEGNLKAASSILQSIDQRDSTFLAAQVYLAKIYLDGNQFAKAEKSYDYLIDNYEKIPAEHASDIRELKWNRAIALLNTDIKSSEAISILNELAQEKGEIGERANVLKSQLNSFWRGLVF